MINSSNTPSAQNRKAFTLIELLVVIAIIAILASILFPVFGRARENARRTNCQSNLKQIGLSMLQYAQDYDECYPGVNRNFPTGAQADTPWDQAIRPYLGQKIDMNNRSPMIFQCMSDTLPRQSGATITNQSARSYAMAARSDGAQFSGPLKTDVNGKNYWEGRMLAAIPEPAGTLMIVENPNANNRVDGSNQAGVNSPDQQDAPYGTFAPGVPAPIHFEGWNYLFVDGHVKWLRPLQTISTPGRAPGSWTTPRGMWTIIDTD
jgi:prepilin-type N-terminal cleavage/methylation domain-containing protein/prepilin-type processing-associated H-X9-DG protein